MKEILTNHKLSHQIFVSSFVIIIIKHLLLLAYVVNVRTGVENYCFDEYDEIQEADVQQQESTSLFDYAPALNYLKYQQGLGITYANPNADEETAFD